MVRPSITSTFWSSTWYRPNHYFSHILSTYSSIFLQPTTRLHRSSITIPWKASTPTMYHTNRRSPFPSFAYRPCTRLATRISFGAPPFYLFFRSIGKIYDTRFTCFYFYSVWGDMGGCNVSFFHDILQVASLHSVYYILTAEHGQNKQYITYLFVF